MFHLEIRPRVTSQKRVTLKVHDAQTPSGLLSYRGEDVLISKVGVDVSSGKWANHQKKNMRMLKDFGSKGKGKGCMKVG